MIKKKQVFVFSAPVNSCLLRTGFSDRLIHSIAGKHCREEQRALKFQSAFILHTLARARFSMQKNYYRTAFNLTYSDSPAQSGCKMTSLDAIFFMGNKLSSHSLFALPPKRLSISSSRFAFKQAQLVGKFTPLTMINFISHTLYHWLGGSQYTHKYIEPAAL